MLDNSKNFAPKTKNYSSGFKISSGFDNIPEFVRQTQEYFQIKLFFRQYGRKMIIK